MLTAAALGLIVGLIMALTGAGGGILAVPLLVFGLGLGVVEAGPVGLLAVGTAAALGALLGLKAGSVRYRAALFMAAAGVLFTPLGVWLAMQLGNRWLGIFFAVLMLLVAYRTLRQALGGPVGPPVRDARLLPCIRDAADGRFIWTTRCARALALSGAVAGLMSGLLGVGGGFALVPALQRYTDLTMQSVVATSLAVITLVALTGVALNPLASSMNWALALPFTLGTLGGMLAGRLIAAQLAGPQIQMGFAALTASVALALIARYLL